MKTIVWIIVLVLIGWGIWWFVQKDPATDDQAAQAGAALNEGVGSDSSSASPAEGTGTPAGEDETPYEDKG